MPGLASVRDTLCVYSESLTFFFGGQRSEIALCRLLEISGSKETKTAENTSASWKDNKSNTAFKVNPSSLEGTLNLYVS